MSVDNFQKKVGMKVRETRMRRGLLQRDFEKFGYKIRHYQKIESGDLNLTLKSLFKISEALDVEVDELITDRTADFKVYRKVFDECPFGIILWELKDPEDRFSLCVYDHNKYGAKAVYRNLSRSKGKRMIDLFPLAEEQGMLDIFWEVIKTGEPRFTPELIRYDKDFPFTVFSTKFIKCGDNLAAAIFTNITERYLARQQAQQQKKQLEQLNKLPKGESDQVQELKEEVDALRRQLGLEEKYRF